MTTALARVAPVTRGRRRNPRSRLAPVVLAALALALGSANACSAPPDALEPCSTESEVQLCSTDGRLGARVCELASACDDPLYPCGPFWTPCEPLVFDG
jgi:hypothetical protein